MSRPTSDPVFSVVVSLPSDLARTIDGLAKQRGKDRAEFIVNFLQEQLSSSALSFEDVIAPLAGDFGASGMTEDDLDALVERERQAIWDENVC